MKPVQSNAELTKLIAKKALEMIHATDAVLTESGKMNPVTYIFRSKNYYGMSDRQEIVVSASADDSNEPLTPEEIAKEFARAGRVYADGR